MLDSIHKNNFVRKKIAEKRAGLLEWFDLLMAVHDDGQLRDRLARLKAEIGKIGDRDKETPARNAGQIMATLEEIKNLAAEAEADITHVSRFAFFED